MMTRFQIKKLASAVGLSALAGAIVLFVGHGCSKIGDANRVSSSSLASGAAGVSEIKIFPNTKTVSTVYAKQFLDNMVSCTGLGIESARTRGEWNNRRGSLSEYGYATDVTPPMLMSIAAVAGEVCSDLIDKEKDPAATRMIFENFNLAGATNSTEIEGAIQRLALSCWQRRASPEETNLIRDMVVDTTSSVANNGEPSALVLCTAMLASYKAIEM